MCIRIKLYTHVYARVYVCMYRQYVCVLRAGENTSGIRPADHSVRDRHTVITL